MTHPAATPPTAEQVEALLRGAYNRQYGLEAPWSCPSMTTVLRDALVTALAPAERAEAAPECWALYQQSDGKRLNSITFPDVGSAMQAAGCTANPVAVRGLYAEAPTRAGALDAAGATEAERPEVEHG